LKTLLSNIFGSSPVLPLERHVNISYQCTKQLNNFFKAAIAGNWDRAAEYRNTIEELEHKADELKKEIRMHLPKSLFMPVPRQDLLELLLVQDNMANKTKDVSGLVMGRKIQIPAPIADEFLIFVSRNVDAAKQARKSVRELDELFTTGFRGAEALMVESLIEELDQIETETDNQQASLRASLFNIEDSLDPITVIFLYKVIELTGEIADMAERIGRRLELLLSH
jgi:predicted phosphate transport protein (TIGR00153 family)